MTYGLARHGFSNHDFTFLFILSPMIIFFLLYSMPLSIFWLFKKFIIIFYLKGSFTLGTENAFTGSLPK